LHSRQLDDFQLHAVRGRGQNDIVAGVAPIDPGQLDVVAGHGQDLLGLRLVKIVSAAATAAARSARFARSASEALRRR
jgi:hypothetical protein